MVWVRIDDQFPQHPKVVGVGPLGIAMQVAGLCYSSRYLTDGFVPGAAVPTLLDFSELDEHAFNGAGGVCWLAVEKLVSANIWVQVDGGYQIHDYDKYQFSREQVLKERAATARRQARFQQKHSTNAVSNAVSNASLTGDSRPNNAVPVPVPLTPLSPFADAQGDVPPGGGASAQGAPAPVKTKRMTRIVNPNPSLTPEQESKLLAKYSDVWADQEARDIMALALDSYAAKTYPHTDRYVDNWLRKDATPIRERRKLAKEHADGINQRHSQERTPTGTELQRSWGAGGPAVKTPL